jgi:RNA-directed DNA polymerase
VKRRNMRKYYTLYGRLLDLKVLENAFKQVKKARGAPGLDNQTIKEFERNLEEELMSLLAELKEKKYEASPVKRVEIDKPDGGKRKLGISTVRDRVVQQAVRNILEPIFDKDFHPSSYGYRKGRSCHHAISKAQLFMRKYKKKWVVDMDLSKCFDRLDHEFIMKQLREKVTDGSILNLVRQFLESGVMVCGEYEATEVGSPQGGVISPLLANIYLDKFDQFMKSRGHRIVRYADDILILCGSKKASENARRVATEYLEGEMKLTVNAEKTHIVHSYKGVKFLGVEIHTGYTRIQEKKLKSFKAKVKKITRKTGGRNLRAVIKELNPVIRGFIHYFRVANCKGVMKTLMRWIRRRLRAVQMFLWKRPTRMGRRLRQLGYYQVGKYQKISMRRWRNSKSKHASMAMPDKWLHEEMKLFDMGSVDTGCTISAI